MAQGLERFFVGDKGWDRFASGLASDWESCEFQEELLAKFRGDESIAIAVYGRHFEEALAWADAPAAALDDETPVACMRSAKLRKRLKAALMRAPR